MLTTRNTGLDTDYVAALQNAQRDLLERSAALTRDGGPPPCKAMVWFTDGRYDLEPRTVAAPGRGLTVPYARDIPITSAAAEARVLAIGQRLMCKSGGLIDQLRESQTKVLAVVLDQELTPAASSLLQAASEDSPPGTCGTHGGPASGLYLPASQDAQLLFFFSSLFDTPAAVRYCPVPGQASCPFTTVAGLSSFSLEISTPASEDKVILRGPSGDQVELSPGGPYASTVSGARVTAEWFSPQAVEVDAQLSDSTAAWVGRWQLSFLNPSGGAGGPGTYTLRLRADLIPSVFGSTAATVGQPDTLSLGFADSTGTGMSDSPLLDGALLRAALVNLDNQLQTPVSVMRAGAGSWVATFTPMATGGGVPHLALALSASFAPSAGVTVTTEPRQIPLTISPPLSYPSVSPSQLQLPSVRGRAETTGVTTVMGPARGTGCVWAQASTIDLPQTSDIARMRLSPAPTSPASCLRVRAGQRIVVAVVARPRAGGLGQASGAITFHLIGTAGRQLTSVVHVSFDMLPAPNVARAIAIFVVLLAAGIAIPVGLLLAVNWYGARFASPQLLRCVARDVEASPAGLVEVPPSGVTTSREAPLVVSAGDCELVANERPSRAKRAFQLDDGHFRFAARPLGRRRERLPSLLLGPYGVVETDSGVVLAGTSGCSLHRYEQVGRHQVPLWLAQTWILDLDHSFTSDAGSTEAMDNDEGGWKVRGRLLILVPSNSPQDAGEVLREAARCLQEHGAALADGGRDGSGPRVTKRSLIARLRRRPAPSPGPPQPKPEPRDEDLFNTRI